MFDDIRAQFFPAQVGQGVEVRAVDAAEIGRVWKALVPQIFTALTDLGQFEMPVERGPRAAALRALHAARHTERFVFYTAAGEPIGWSNGEMLDAETYFMTWSGILPAYQNGRLYSAFLRQLMPYLHAIGYERVASKHMVNNRRVLVAKIKAGFHVVGVELDERWGAQVSLVYYFYADRRQGFGRAFSLEQFAPPPDYFG